MKKKIFYLSLPLFVLLLLGASCGEDTTNTNSTTTTNDAVDTNEAADSNTSTTDILGITVEELPNEYPQAYLDADMPLISNDEISKVEFINNALFVASDFYGDDPPSVAERYLITLTTTDEVEDTYNSIKSDLTALNCELVTLPSLPYSGGLDCYDTEYSIAILVATGGSAGDTQVSIIFNNFPQ